METEFNTNQSKESEKPLILDNSKPTPGWINELPPTSETTIKVISPAGPGYDPSKVHFVEPGKGLPFVHRLKTHWGFNMDGRHVEVPCLGGVGNCPACDLHLKVKLAERSARNTSNATEADILHRSAFRLRPADYFLYVVITPDERIQVLKLRPDHADDLHRLLKTTPDKHGINPLSPTEGVWFALSREGTGANTTYRTRLATMIGTQNLDRSPLSDDVMSELQEHSIDLRRVFPTVSGGAIAEMITTGQVMDDVRAALELLEKFAG